MMQIRHLGIVLALGFGGLALTELIIPELGYVILGVAGLLAARWSWPYVRWLFSMEFLTPTEGANKNNRIKLLFKIVSSWIRHRLHSNQ